MGLSERPTDWSVCVLVMRGVRWAWEGCSGRNERLEEVTAGPHLTSPQVHCGQLSDSDEWSLQAVEKHVSGRSAG